MNHRQRTFLPRPGGRALAGLHRALLGLLVTACMPAVGRPVGPTGEPVAMGHLTSGALLPGGCRRLSQADGAVASSGDAKPALQGNPTAVWSPDGGTPAWVAIPLATPAPETVLVSWNAAGFRYLNGENAPKAYRLEASADSRDGRDGTWRTVVEVADNAVRTRMDTVHAPGARWIRLTVASTGSGPLRLRDLGVHGLVAGRRPDAWFMLGDSITDGSWNAVASRDFVATVQRALPDHSPVVVDGGTQGDNAGQGLAKLPDALTLCPPACFVGIAFGTNDTAQNRPLTTYRQNLQQMVDLVVASGRTPMLPRIPWFPNPRVTEYNAVVDAVVAANHLPAGPDLYAWFTDHPDELGPDQIHPKEVGRRSIQRLWGEAVVRAYSARPR